MQSGDNIYAYCHVMTKQVLYSLSRKLENRTMLKQLPDTGANNKPRALRKDLWKPFFTLTIPSPKPRNNSTLNNNPFASRRQNPQGLHTFKKLLEWRKVHETMWKSSPLLSRPFTQGELDEFQEKLDERGGSKKNNVYDEAKRQKKMMRIKEVCDQKANSVADLAAVLLHQEDMGRKLDSERKIEKTRARQKEVTRMVKLAQDPARVLVLHEDIIRLKEQLNDTTMQENQKQLRTELSSKRKERQAVSFAIDAVAFARRLAAGNYRERFQHILKVLETTSPHLRDDTANIKNVKALLQPPMSLLQKMDRAVDETEKALMRYYVMKHIKAQHLDATLDAKLQLLPVPLKDKAMSFNPSRETEIEAPELTSEALANFLPSWPPRIFNDNVPKKGMVRAALKREATPVYTTKGLRIAWAQPLDAEYAEAWPRNVRHSYMGYHRHVAPTPGEEIDNLSTYRRRIARNTSNKAVIASRAARQSNKRRTRVGDVGNAMAS